MACLFSTGMATSRYRQTQMLSSGHLDLCVGRAGRCRKPVLFNAVRPLSETYGSETGGGVYKSTLPVAVMAGNRECAFYVSCAKDYFLINSFMLSSGIPKLKLSVVPSLAKFTATRLPYSSITGLPLEPCSVGIL